MNGVEKDKQNAISSLENYLNDLIQIGTKQSLKKVSLLSYWMKDYCNYLKDEDNFDPKKLKRYERGDIIKVNLGYNVGSEEGGLHYAVVVDKKNQLNSKVVTVVPLTSIKSENVEMKWQDVLIGNEIYEKLKVKHTTIYSQLTQDLERNAKELLELTKRASTVDELRQKLTDEGQPDEIEERILEVILELETQNSASMERVEIALDICKKQMKLMEKVRQEIEKMKSGSIALVGQLTTISKMRIYDPRNKYNVLSGIKLSPESLDELNKKIKELYVFE